MYVAYWCYGNRSLMLLMWVLTLTKAHHVTMPQETLERMLLTCKELRALVYSLLSEVQYAADEKNDVIYMY